MGDLRNWIDDRTGYRGFLRALLLLNFPVNRATRWRYVWGGSLAGLFLVQVVTGMILMLVYSPSEAAAWGSVQYLESQVTAGHFIRAVHHYASHMMLVVIILHLLIVVITAGYRKPKEVTFWSGLMLAGMIGALAMSGNPLPWDQKGYWAYQIETGIVGTMPLVGPSLKTLILGGTQFGNLTLTRVFTLHVVILPALAILILVIHIALTRREQLRAARSDAVSHQLGASESNSKWESYWPHQSCRTLLVLAILILLICAQLLIYPRLRHRYVSAPSADWQPDIPLEQIQLEAPADRAIPFAARPEWYARPLYELRYRVPKQYEVLVTGLLPAVAVGLLFLIPFYESLFGRRAGHAVAILIILSGIGGMAGITRDGLRRDQNDEHYRAARRREIDYAGRAAWLAASDGISPAGPATLLRNDPKAMGPLLFARHCASCHTWNGHDGTGHIVKSDRHDTTVPTPPLAADLFGFGGRPWIAQFLANPAGERFFAPIAGLEGGDAFIDGEMADWSSRHVAPEGPLSTEQLNAVASLVSREAQRPDAASVDQETLDLGIAVFSGGAIREAQGSTIELDEYCLQCHNLKAGDPNKEGGDGYAPDLNGYGSVEWLSSFIRDPGAERFYADSNLMPSFDSGQLPDRDLRLLVDWLRNDWKRSTK